LNLIGVQVHGHHAVHADGRDHVGDDLGSDRHPRRPRTAVLTGIAEVRYRGGDSSRRSPFKRIDHHQNFHEVVVGGRASGLQDENVAAANVFQQLDHHLAVGKAADDTSAKTDVHVLDDRFRELGIGVAGKDPHALKRHRAAQG